MANTPNTFPPKFSKNILYPSVKNLDTLPMPSGDLPLGIYFNLNFPGYGTNATPVLTYGKHKFDISVVPSSTQFTSEGYELEGDYPKLKNKSRILFEFKDSAGNIIFSDYTPIYKTDGFTGYVWIKKDPLRTYEEIQEGPGKITIVAIANVSDPNWKNRYNVRMTKSINIDLVTSNGIVYQNTSPIIFQANTGSIGSGSGLNVYEETISNNSDPDIGISNVIISASKLKTYSGEISRVETFIKVSGSVDNPDWQFLSTHILSSSLYEDGIYKDYGDGINPISEQWSHDIPHSMLPNIGSDNNKVKFQFKFRNPEAVFAKDVYNQYDETQDYVLQYPNLSDSDNTLGWLEFQGTDIQTGTSGNQTILNDVVEETSNGQFSFKSGLVLGTDSGVTYDNSGNPKEFSNATTVGAGGRGSSS